MGFGENKGECCARNDIPICREAKPENDGDTVRQRGNEKNCGSAEGKGSTNKQVEELFARVEQTSRAHQFESTPYDWGLIDKPVDELLNKEKELRTWG